MLKFKITNTNKSKEEIERIKNAEFRRGMQSTLIDGERLIAPKTPVGVTGHTRQGIFGKVINPLSGELGIQGPASRYGDFVELGRRRGKFPPRDAIALWLRRTDKGRAFVARVKARYNLKNDKAALIQATFLKSRGISRRGTRGAFMFKKSVRGIAAAAEKNFNESAKKIEVKLSDK